MGEEVSGAGSRGNPADFHGYRRMQRRIRLELLRAVCSVVSVPVIASGGCGRLEHFSQVFEETGADAALAASLFHFGN